MGATLRKPLEVGTEAQEAEYTAWLRAKVQEAIDDPCPGIPHEVVMAEMYAVIEKAEARHRQRQQQQMAA